MPKKPEDMSSIRLLNMVQKLTDEIARAEAMTGSLPSTPAEMYREERDTYYAELVARFERAGI